MNRRGFIAAAMAALGGAGACARRMGLPFDAVIARDSATGDAPVFASVQAALDAAPRDRTHPFRILVTRGRWHEKLIIDKPFIHLVGEDPEQSVLTFNAAAGHKRPDGEPWGTWGCASVIVRAADFRATRLTIENAFDYLGHLRNPQLETVGSNGAQGVALMLDRGSDRALIEDSRLVGHQDTLFVDSGCSLLRRCYVAGSVDFVFGAGRVVLDSCDILSRYRPDKPRQGYVAAPSTPASQQHGLTFVGCRLTREPQVPARSVALGRAWRPTRDFPDGRYGDPAVLGSAVFLDCWMDEHIAPEGWDAMGYTARDGTRVQLEPRDARLFEFDSRGPGAIAHPRRRLLTAEEARSHAVSAVLAGWHFPRA